LSVIAEFKFAMDFIQKKNIFVSTRGPSLLANKWTWHWKKPKVGLSNAIGLSDFLFAESDLYYHYILTISKAGLW